MGVLRNSSKVLILAASVLVLLHAPGGRAILLNPAAVVSMQSRIHGQKNQNLHADVECIINTDDGRFISVVETCEAVRDAFRQANGKNGDAK